MTPHTHDILRIALWLIIIAPILIVLAYATVRAASWAYFRTKLEHLRTTMKELGGHDVE